MRLLLDTHVFIWALVQPGKLPDKSRLLIEDPEIETSVSAVSLWEIAIKARIGKLDLGGISPLDLITTASRTGIQTIPLDPDEGATYGNLKEATHTDPFDRMLIWQAISRKMTLISGDAQFKRFVPDGLKLLWD